MSEEAAGPTFRKFEGPWGAAEALGCRNLFYGDRLILDIFQYQQSSPDEEVTLGDEVVPDSHLIGFTEVSRIWRITFDRPFAVRVRDRNIRKQEPKKLSLPGPCSFTEDSDWLLEVEFDPNSRPFTPTHYVFALVDDTIEILGDNQPTVEEMPNEFAESSR
jgi:hypothetical protein